MGCRVSLCERIRAIDATERLISGGEDAAERAATTAVELGTTLADWHEHVRKLYMRGGPFEQMGADGDAADVVRVELAIALHRRFDTMPPCDWSWRAGHSAVAA